MIEKIIQSVLWNGKLVSLTSPELTLLPGVSHSLVIEPDWEYLGLSSAAAVVTKIVPNGDIDRHKVRLKRGEIAPVIELGPFTCPPVYEHEAGVVYRRGYRLEIQLKETAAGKTLAHLSFYQGLMDKATSWRQGDDLPVQPERLITGEKERLVYNPIQGVDTVLGLRLSDSVLRDQNALGVQHRLRQGASALKLTCELRVTEADGETKLSENLELTRSETWSRYDIHPDEWAVGDYRIELLPVMDGKVWNEGPAVVYRRRDPDPDEVAISPLTPWKLRRDRKREEIAITDFRKAFDELGDGTIDSELWCFQTSDGGTALIRKNVPKTDPITLEPDIRFQSGVSLELETKGSYAVFATVVNAGCLIQVGDDELVRPVRSAPSDGETFVCAGELKGGIIRIFTFDCQAEADSGLARLRLVPVTEESVRSFYRETGYPPIPLFGVNDWCEYFSGSSRLAQDQFDTLIGGQAELGMRTLDWSAGRSWVEYHSDLPKTTRFPTVPYEEALEKYSESVYYRGRIVMINWFHPLESVYGNRRRFDAEVWPWLAMQRHYGINEYGGMFASQFFRDHQKWRRWSKNAPEPDKGELCYFFPEVRRERIDILLEVAKKGADGLLIGCCRQVPILLYHPEMVKAYFEKTGVNPQEIDASDGETYRDWIIWRADFFTQTLRDLKKELGPIEEQKGKRIAVALRIPSAGLFYNLAQGLDVEQWLREGLVDQLQLDPLEDRGGRGSHDVRPYLKLGRRFGVPVVGGATARSGVGGRWLAASSTRWQECHAAATRWHLAADLQRREVARCDGIRSVPARAIHILAPHQPASGDVDV